MLIVGVGVGIEGRVEEEEERRGREVVRMRVIARKRDGGQEGLIYVLNMLQTCHHATMNSAEG